MGQRHMSYVITQRYNDSQATVHTVYNQWNYIRLQLIKLTRAVKFFKKAEKNKNDIYDLFESFFAAHGLSPEAGWVGGIIEDENFKDGTYTDCFQEDNNNGWTIIKIAQSKTFGSGNYKDEPKYHIELCCIYGSEDCPDNKCFDADNNWIYKYNPVSTRTYFTSEILKSERLSEREKKSYLKDIDYLVSNTVYNPKLKAEARKLIRTQLIPKKVKKSKKRSVKAYKPDLVLGANLTVEKAYEIIAEN